jgi:lipopolysaccharide/colanic/teichoic acid biosynthesis glycosyltransferase
MVRGVVGHTVSAGISRSFDLASRATVSPARPPHRLYDAAQRSIDILIATPLLLFTFPVILVACVAIALSTRQAPLILQRRVGWLGREFTMLKLRTMSCEDAPPSFLLAKPPLDERVTAVGRLLRRTSIDELPQLINVIAGQMTLVGPRPGLPSEVAEYRAPWLRRLDVRPGLTGLWQVSGRSSLPPQRWMALDRCYVARRSTWLDLRILARTVSAVVSMRGAW